MRILTDYPVEGDGDHSVKKGVARAWDRNKYVLISIWDKLYWVKRGYITRESDGKPLGDYQIAALPRNWDWSKETPSPTKLDVSREVMADRRERKTVWEVFDGYEWSMRRRYGCLHDAVTAMRDHGKPGWVLYRNSRFKRGSSSGGVAEIEEDGSVTIFVRGRKKQADISAKQIRRLLRRAS
jgi:hypothetical protein